jgi:iron complex transport system permease protein
MAIKYKFILLFLLLLVFFFIDIICGSVSLPISDVWAVLTGHSDNPIYKEIILDHRLPKAITAVLTGASLSVAGVLMQTMFHNPLAGPDVLGVTSGAGLGVALLTMGTTFLPAWMLGGSAQIVAAILGAAIILLLVIVASVKVSNTVSLLIVGIMFGYFTGAIVSVLQSVSDPETLKLFISWTFGSLSAVGWDKLFILMPITFAGIVMSMLMQKQLNALLLGKNYANGLGISVSRIRLLIIIATAILAGTSTAFTGPISFIGITMPHAARDIFRTSNHRIVFPASILCGACVLLICDCLSQISLMHGLLPINAVTALFGAPIICWIIIKNK